MKKSVKKYLIVFILILAAAPAAYFLRGWYYNRYYHPHVGMWSSTNASDTKAVVILNKDGTGRMEFNNEVMEFRYVFDYTRKPVWLDFISTRDGKPCRVKLIVEFLDKDRLKWLTFFNDTRPAAFSEEFVKDIMVLNRVSPGVKA